METALFFLPVLIISTGFLIRAKILKKKNQIFIFKPISTLTVIGALLVSFSAPGMNMLYSAGILTGLLFSFGGDITLLFEKNRKAFAAGLVFFLATYSKQMPVY